jgi:hypothetical protein
LDSSDFFILKTVIHSSPKHVGIKIGMSRTITIGTAS